MSEKKYHILLAEDNEDLRIELAYILEDEGHSVYQAENGTQAFELFTHNKIDVLYTDVYMPQMGGVELSRKCKKLNPDIHVILLSGGGRDLNAGGDKEYMEATMKEAGASNALKKPFRIEDFLHALDELD